MNSTIIEKHLASCSGRRWQYALTRSRLAEQMRPVAKALLALPNQLRGATGPLDGDSSRSQARVVVEVPEYLGHFEMDARGHLLQRIRSKRFETDLARFVRALLSTEDDVVDVGANVGLFTVLSAKTASSGRVLAIEPSPHALPMLTENIRSNGVSNAILFRGAATATVDTVELHHMDGFAEYSSLGDITHPDAPRQAQSTSKVEGRPLDDLVAEHDLHPALIKIDVEGAEGNVLEGSQKTLRQHRPVIVSELDQRLLPNLGSSVAKVLSLLRDLDYRVYDFATGSERFDERRFYGEILAVPRSGDTES